MTCKPGCACPLCLVPEHSAPRCTKHERCVGRDGHGGDRVGVLRAIRVLAGSVVASFKGGR
jgi:hypothetical protein